MAEIVQVSCQIYSRLLIFYPREFRRRFGGEMVQLFGDLLHQALIEHDLRGMVFLWCSAIWELVTVAVPLWLYDGSVVAAALSFVVSAALFLALFRAVS